MNSELLNILIASLIASILSALIMHSWMARVCSRASLGHLAAGKEIGVRDYKQSHEHLSALVNARREGYEKGKLWVNSCHAAELVAARASGFLEGDQRGRGIGYDQGFESGLEAKGEADYQKAYDDGRSKGYREGRIDGRIRGEKYGREVGRKEAMDDVRTNMLLGVKDAPGMGFPEVLGLKGRTVEEMLADGVVFTEKPRRPRKPKATPVGQASPVPPLPPSVPIEPAVAKRKRVGRPPVAVDPPAKPTRTRAKSKP